MKCRASAGQVRARTSSTRCRRPSREPSPLTERKIRTPIACALDDASLADACPECVRFPIRVMRRSAKRASSPCRADPTHAAASMIHAFGGPRPHLQTVSLLKPVERPSEYAYLVLDQVEGAAALRYRLPEDPAKDSHLRNIELGLGQRALRASGAARAWPTAAQSPPPTINSASRCNAPIRICSASAKAGCTCACTTRRATRRTLGSSTAARARAFPPVKWPIAANVRGRTEMARSDDTHVPLMLFGRGTAVARARRVGADWEFDAETTALPDPSAFGQNLVSNVAYLGNASGLYVQAQTGEGARASAAYYAFRATGDGDGTEGTSARPRPAWPIARVVAAKRSCDDPAHRRGLLARYSAPDLGHGQLGSASAISERGGRAVRHSRKRLRHRARRRRGGVRRRRLCVANARCYCSKTWSTAGCFARAPDSNAVQYRTMKCHFDPDLEVPSDVYRAPGTLVPRGG